MKLKIKETFSIISHLKELEKFASDHKEIYHGKYIEEIKKKFFCELKRVSKTKRFKLYWFYLKIKTKIKL